jgi:hypothetical protein
MLVKNGALNTLDEAVRKGVPGLCTGVSDPEIPTRSIELALELAASIRENSPKGPTGSFEIHVNLTKELGGDESPGIAQEDLRPGEGRGRIAGGDLPDFADALEAADVKAVEPDQLAGLLGLDMGTGGRGTGFLKHSLCSLGEEASLRGTMLLEQPEALATGPESVASQGSVDRARSDMDPA